MARPRRYQLLMYTRMLDHWRSRVITLGLVILLLTALGFFVFPTDQAWRIVSLGGISGLTFVFAIVLYIFRKSAYVTVGNKNLVIKTPVFKLEVSYKRIKRTFTAEMGGLYAGKKVSGVQRNMIRPFATRTAIIAELSRYPMSHNTLKMFLAPLFFPSKMPHFVFLVDDWMKFSMELESARSVRRGIRRPGSASRDSGQPSSGLLASLREKK